MKESFRSSESFPRAEIVKVGPIGDKGGNSASAKACEKAEIPVLEVKAMAAKSWSGVLEVD